MTNTQLSYWGGGEPVRVPNTFNKAMSLPQPVHWKSASGKKIASLEKHVFFKLVPIISVPVGHKVVDTSWVLKIKVDSAYKCRLIVQGFSQILGMSVTSDHEKGTITVSQKYIQRTWYSATV